MKILDIFRSKTISILHKIIVNQSKEIILLEVDREKLIKINNQLANELAETKLYFTEKEKEYKETIKNLKKSNLVAKTQIADIESPLYSKNINVNIYS